MGDITVRITPAVAAEYVAREIPERPFSLITDAGNYSFSPAEASSLLGDADYYSDTNGPGEALTFGQRRAYAALAKQLRAAGVQLSARDEAFKTWDPQAAPATPPAPRPVAPPAPAPTPVPVGDLPPGTAFRYKGTILTVDRDQSDHLRAGLIWIAGGQRGLAFSVDMLVVPLRPTEPVPFTATIRSED